MSNLWDKFKNFKLTKSNFSLIVIIIVFIILVVMQSFAYSSFLMGLISSILMVSISIGLVILVDWIKNKLPDDKE